jgi:dihydrofolate reductase
MSPATDAGSRPHLILVAAMSENGVIGRDGGLPWRLKSDMRHFRAVTMGKPVVMGRRTYLSIGRTLPGRTSIVVSRDPQFAARGVLVAGSLEQALRAAQGDLLRRGIDEIAVIGGGDLFAQTLPLADRLEITVVHTKSGGEVVFPLIDLARWHEINRREQPAGPDDAADMTFITYSPVAGGQGLPAL